MTIAQIVSTVAIVTGYVIMAYVTTEVFRDAKVARGKGEDSAEYISRAAGALWPAVLSIALLTFLLIAVSRVTQSARGGDE